MFMRYHIVTESKDFQPYSTSIYNEQSFFPNHFIAGYDQDAIHGLPLAYNSKDLFLKYLAQFSHS